MFHLPQRHAPDRAPRAVVSCPPKPCGPSGTGDEPSGSHFRVFAVTRRLRTEVWSTQLSIPNCAAFTAPIVRPQSRFSFAGIRAVICARSRKCHDIRNGLVVLAVPATILTRLAHLHVAKAAITRPSFTLMKRTTRVIGKLSDVTGHDRLIRRNLPPSRRAGRPSRDSPIRSEPAQQEMLVAHSQNRQVRHHPPIFQSFSLSRARRRSRRTSHHYQASTGYMRAARSDERMTFHSGRSSSRRPHSATKQLQFTCPTSASSVHTNPRYGNAGSGGWMCGGGK